MSAHNYEKSWLTETEAFELIKETESALENLIPDGVDRFCEKVATCLNISTRVRGLKIFVLRNLVLWGKLDLDYCVELVLSGDSRLITRVFGITDNGTICSSLDDAKHAASRSMSQLQSQHTESMSSAMSLESDFSKMNITITYIAIRHTPEGSIKIIIKLKSNSPKRTNTLKIWDYCSQSQPQNAQKLCGLGVEQEAWRYHLNEIMSSTRNAGMGAAGDRRSTEFSIIAEAILRSLGESQKGICYLINSEEDQAIDSQLQRMMSILIMNSNARPMILTAVYGMCPIMCDYDVCIVHEPCQNACSATAWKAYLHEEILSHGRTFVSCMFCDIPLEFEFMGIFVRESLLQRSIVNQLKKTNNRIKSCPGSSCNMLMCINKSMLNGNASQNGYLSCPQCMQLVCCSCGKFYHGPSNCSLWNRWYSEFLSEDKSTNFLELQCKACPMCHVVIIREDGCLHMKCRCSYEFCWECLTQWSNHEDSFRCNDSTVLCDNKSIDRQEWASLQFVTLSQIQRFSNGYYRDLIKDLEAFNSQISLDILDHLYRLNRNLKLLVCSMLGLLVDWCYNEDALFEIYWVKLQSIQKQVVQTFNKFDVRIRGNKIYSASTAENESILSLNLLVEKVLKNI